MYPLKRLKSEQDKISWVSNAGLIIVLCWAHKRRVAFVGKLIFSSFRSKIYGYNIMIYQALELFGVVGSGPFLVRLTWKPNLEEKTMGLKISARHFFSYL